jgi:TRAP-type C4-dicarboxylate transport system substrate-binding protein
MKRTISMLVIPCLGLAVMALPALAADQIVLRLAHITAPGGMLDKRAHKFAELVAEKTNGKVKVEIYPAQQLGTIKEILQGLSMGTIDMAQEAESFMDTFGKYIHVVRERVRKKTGIRTLPGFSFRPAFHLWTQKRQILTPDKLDGIKLRVWQSKVLVDMWNGLGATAVPLAWGDVYLALSQHVVNGMVHNIVQVRDEKFYEQLNYCTKLDFMQLYDVTWISDAKYKSLPKDVQQALTEASQESADWFVNFGQGLVAEAQNQLEKAGIVFADGDRPAWVKKARAVQEKLEKDGVWSKGLMKKLGMQ